MRQPLYFRIPLNLMTTASLQEKRIKILCHFSRLAETRHLLAFLYTTHTFAMVQSFATWRRWVSRRSTIKRKIATRCGKHPASTLPLMFWSQILHIVVTTLSLWFAILRLQRLVSDRGCCSCLSGFTRRTITSVTLLISVHFI